MIFSNPFFTQCTVFNHYLSFDIKTFDWVDIMDIDLKPKLLFIISKTSIFLSICIGNFNLLLFGYNYVFIVQYVNKIC